MSLEIAHFLTLSNIKYFDLPITISDGNFILIAERDWTDIVIDLAGFIEPGDLGWASRPKIKWGIKSNSDLIFIRPVQQIKVEVILQIGCV